MRLYYKKLQKKFNRFFKKDFDVSILYDQKERYFVINYYDSQINEDDKIQILNDINLALTDIINEKKIINEAVKIINRK